MMDDQKIRKMVMSFFRNEIDADIDAGLGTNVISCNRAGSNALHVLASMESPPLDKGQG